MRFKSIGIAVAIICSLCLFGLVLTPYVSAQLATDAHIATNIVDHDGTTLVTAFVSIDSLSYGSGDGVVDLDGTFYVHNYDEDNSISYDGELRLEIFDMDGNTYTLDSKTPVSGSVKMERTHAIATSHLMLLVIIVAHTHARKDRFKVWLRYLCDGR